jgi:hypothetical protein
VRRRDFGQHLRQLDRGRVRALEEVVVEGQFLQLARLLDLPLSVKAG